MLSFLALLHFAERCNVNRSLRCFTSLRGATSSGHTTCSLCVLELLPTMISLSWMDDNAATPDASMLGANDVWLVCFDASCNFQGRRSYLSRPEFLDGHGCWHPCAECSGHSSSHEAIAKIRSTTGCVGGSKTILRTDYQQQRSPATGGTRR